MSSSVLEVSVLKQIIVELGTSIQEGVLLALSYFGSGDRRVFVGYLLSAAILALYVYLRRPIQQRTGFLKYVFHPKIWRGPSARVDYGLWILNGIVKVVWIAPYLILGLYLAYYVNEYMISFFGYRGSSEVTEWPLIWVLLLYTFTLVVVGDFLSYVFHWCFHHVPFLWEFHKIHHSATTLNPMTQYRLHPVELIVNNMRGIVTFGLATGIFDYVSSQSISKVTFVGANVFSVAFLVWGSNLRHSHVKLRYFHFLEKIFISPVQHQIHHSTNPKYFNKNLGAKLAIWDGLFGSLVRSREFDSSTMRFGLGRESRNYSTAWKSLWRPFKNIGSIN
jgi:sterol desaturase/sphingolipid hydroxylase (fatty acid hydroxylase superfamily)